MKTKYLNTEYYIETIDINKFKKIEFLQLRQCDNWNNKVRVKISQIQLTEEEENELIDINIL